MTKKQLMSFVSSSLLVCSAFILCAALGMLINPDAFYKFFSPVQLVPDSALPFPHKSYYWDLSAYAEMALSNRCVAYYPLWPLLIRTLTQPETIEQAAYAFLVTGTIIFFLSIPLLLWVFRKALTHQRLALLLLLAFTLNPMAIFRVIGYTESLFSVLSAILILILLNQSKGNRAVQLVLVFGITFIMSLARPILIPFIGSSVAALATIFFFEHQRVGINSSLSPIYKYAQEIKIAITLILAAFLGYSVYGIFCLQTRGDFLAPFKDQTLWGTKLGIYPELLLFPKSPLIDLLGLYFPLLVLVVSLALIYCKVKDKKPLVWVPQSPFWNILLVYPPLLVVAYLFNYFRLRRKAPQEEASLTKLNTSDFTQTLSSNYVFWFCVYFPVVHSVLIFFTRDRLYSLGRYIFGVPFFFVALGYLCCCIPGKKTYRALWWLIIISAIALVEQWVNYGQNSWLG